MNINSYRDQLYEAKYRGVFINPDRVCLVVLPLILLDLVYSNVQIWYNQGGMAGVFGQGNSRTCPVNSFVKCLQIETMKAGPVEAPCHDHRRLQMNLRDE